jgi:hypothetical protein
MQIIKKEFNYFNQPLNVDGANYVGLTEMHKPGLAKFKTMFRSWKGMILAEMIQPRSKTIHSKIYKLINFVGFEALKLVTMTVQSSGL